MEQIKPLCYAVMEVGHTRTLYEKCTYLTVVTIQLLLRLYRTVYIDTVRRIVQKKIGNHLHSSTSKFLIIRVKNISPEIGN